jgi:hypothetical protein
VFTRVAVGRARVVREIRAAAPLMAAVRAPIPARGPWLTAVLNSRAWAAAPVPVGRRPVAVVVQPSLQERPVAAAFLTLHRRGPATTVRMLGQEALPRPDGRPPARLLARDDGAAGLLAAGILQLLRSLRGPWRLFLAGLPLGDPTLPVLAAALPGSVLANVRSRRLVDDLDAREGPPTERSRDPRVLERWLPALLDREPSRDAQRFLRVSARLHAAIGQVELAVVAEGNRARAALVTLVEGDDRWSWYGWSEAGASRTEMGAPLVTFTARGGGRPARGSGRPLVVDP